LGKLTSYPPQQRQVRRFLTQCLCMVQINFIQEKI
jgi:hypothetical protein